MCAHTGCEEEPYIVVRYRLIAPNWEVKKLCKAHFLMRVKTGLADIDWHRRIY